MTDKVNYDVRELKLGATFTNNKASQYHTIKYDFKPASVDVNKMATVDVGTNNQVTVTVPHLDGAGVPQTVFKGNQRPYTKECVLIIDRVTGEITLEKLSSNIQVKKTRQECASKPRPHTPAAPPPITDTTQRSSSRTKVTTNKRTIHPGNTNNVIPNNSNSRSGPGMVRSPPRQRTEAPQAAPWTGGNSTLASLPMIGLDDTPSPANGPPQTHNDFPRNSTNHEFPRSQSQQQSHEFPRSAQQQQSHEFSRSAQQQQSHEFPRSAPQQQSHEFPRSAPQQQSHDFPRSAPQQQSHDFPRSASQQQSHEFPRSASNHNEFGRNNDFPRGQSGHDFPRAAPPVHNEFPRPPVASQHNNMQQRQPEPSSVPRQADDNSGSSSSSSSDSGSDSDSNSDDDNKSLPRDVLKDDLCLSSSDSD